MSTYHWFLVKTRAGLQCETQAENAEHAQELAIDAWESMGFLHDDIVSIRRLER